jgi:hypothetical protein
MLLVAELLRMYAVIVDQGYLLKRDIARLER